MIVKIYFKSKTVSKLSGITPKEIEDLIEAFDRSKTGSYHWKSPTTENIVFKWENVDFITYSDDDEI